MTLVVTPKTQNITNGTANDGSIVNTMFSDCYTNDSTIASYVNTNIFLLTGGNSASGNNTWAGNQTFQGTDSHSGINTFTGRTNFAQADTTNLINNGDILYDSANNLFKVVNGGLIRTLATTDLVTPYPTGWRGSAVPVYATNTTFTVAYIRDRSSDDTTNITKTGSTTVDLSATGLNKLDAGTIANNTTYYAYTVTNGTTYGLLVSTVNEAVSGTISSANYAYTKKRQMPFCFRTDGSAHIIPFKVINWTPTRAKIAYNVAMSVLGAGVLTSTGQTNILNFDTSSGNTSLATTATWVLPNSILADFHVLCYETSAYIYEDATVNFLSCSTIGTAGFVSGEFMMTDVPVSAAYKIGYNALGGHGFSLDVRAYTVEVV